MLDLASHIVNTKSGHFDPSRFEDRYENALVDLLKKKEAGEKIEPANAAPRVVNLMDWAIAQAGQASLLAAPFNRHVTEARHAHEVGRQEGK